MVVRFIKNNREMFEPFVEDEVPFDEYCRSMGQEGNWAGHVEMQAASLATHCNICIHKLESWTASMSFHCQFILWKCFLVFGIIINFHTLFVLHRSPRLYAQNFDVHEAPQIHLSYHYGEHYNSVHLKEDTCSGPARPLFIEDDTDLSAKSNKADVIFTRKGRW
ncbi:OVARIAN TUMOR DOMAIN-containing deubiquitinating enzyme 7-like [Primulina eburnea]|uniref:OVARIAN TUMOR DOMAIN-containing deubiquitinating enzyme 7-like n=1 Tax=Primulina eburnea TaxID=1245227 RepID=UPI003C6BD940